MKCTLILTVICAAGFALIFSVTPYITGLAFDVIYSSLEKGQIASLYDDQFTMSTGGIQAILVHPVYGTLTGAGDPRREGYAIGY